ncbi:hypothetical protein ACROYT_G035710 [Oculina patagonica]
MFFSCWGHVGHHGYKTQISIGDDCDFTHVMVHEIGHSVYRPSGTSRAGRTVTAISVFYGKMCYQVSKTPSPKESGELK